MNRQEYTQKLQSLSKIEIEKFNADFGGGNQSIEERVRDFVHDPRHEARICHLLNLKTEDEKLVEAAQESAAAAARSATFSKFAFIVSIAAFIVSVFALFIQKK